MPYLDPASDAFEEWLRHRRAQRASARYPGRRQYMGRLEAAISGIPHFAPKGQNRGAPIWPQLAPESDAVRLAGEVVARYECRQRWCYRLLTYLTVVREWASPTQDHLPAWIVRLAWALAAPLARLTLLRGGPEFCGAELYGPHAGRRGCGASSGPPGGFGS